nr:MAG: hypothetical protein [White spot syndrome virus]BDX27753.1 MAG: hypothetical protein [White spot syndrome virus]BDX27913.1 MAG: hypothetical protein [White spot syndrome virus]BDX28075.1 MAG: hypothetical protein [White spot syndrome virus]
MDKVCVISNTRERTFKVPADLLCVATEPEISTKEEDAGIEIETRVVVFSRCVSVQELHTINPNDEGFSVQLFKDYLKLQSAQGKKPIGLYIQIKAGEDLERRLISGGTAYLDPATHLFYLDFSLYPNYSIFNDISSRLKIIDEDTYNGVVFSNSEEKEKDALVLIRVTFSTHEKAIEAAIKKIMLRKVFFKDGDLDFGYLRIPKSKLDKFTPYFRSQYGIVNVEKNIPGYIWGEIMKQRVRCSRWYLYNTDSEWEYKNVAEERVGPRQLVKKYGAKCENLCFRDIDLRKKEAKEKRDIERETESRYVVVTLTHKHEMPENMPYFGPKCSVVRLDETRILLCFVDEISYNDEDVAEILSENRSLRNVSIRHKENVPVHTLLKKGVSIHARFTLNGLDDALIILKRIPKTYFEDEELQAACAHVNLEQYEWLCSNNRGNKVEHVKSRVVTRAVKRRRKCRHWIYFDKDTLNLNYKYFDKKVTASMASKICNAKHDCLVFHRKMELEDLTESAYFKVEPSPINFAKLKSCPDVKYVQKKTDGTFSVIRFFRNMTKGDLIQRMDLFCRFIPDSHTITLLSRADFYACKRGESMHMCTNKHRILHYKFSNAPHAAIEQITNIISDTRGRKGIHIEYAIENVQEMYEEDGRRYEAKYTGTLTEYKRNEDKTFKSLLAPHLTPVNKPYNINHLYEQYGNFDEELEDKLRSGFISYDTYVTAKDNWGRCATGKGACI